MKNESQMELLLDAIGDIQGVTEVLKSEESADLAPKVVVAENALVFLAWSED